MATGADDASTSIRLTAFMRYSGQGWEIPVALDFQTFTNVDAAIILVAFEKTYRKLFGRTIDGLGVEITNWSLIVTSDVLPPMPVTRRLDGSLIVSDRSRQFFDVSLREMVDASEVTRAAMTPGQMVNGPAVIVENETTTIVTSAYRAIGQDDGSLLLTRKECAA